MQLLIDNREHNDLISLLQERHGDIVSLQNLSHGDFHIISPNTTMILERKSTPDLLASVKDTRYVNQKQSLLATYARESIYYVFEGVSSLAFQDNTIDQKIATGCVLSTMVRDDIKVFFTKSIVDTADLITSIIRRLESDPEKFMKKSSSISQPVIASCSKKKTATPKETYQAMLFQVPGVSAKTADAIMEKYQTLTALVLALQSQEHGALKDVKANGRKISSAVVQALVDLVLHKI